METTKSTLATLICRMTPEQFAIFIKRAQQELGIDARVTPANPEMQARLA